MGQALTASGHSELQCRVTSAPHFYIESLEGSSYSTMTGVWPSPMSEAPWAVAPTRVNFVTGGSGFVFVWRAGLGLPTFCFLK